MRLWQQPTVHVLSLPVGLALLDWERPSEWQQTVLRDGSAELDQQWDKETTRLNSREIRSQWEPGPVPAPQTLSILVR